MCIRDSSITLSGPAKAACEHKNKTTKNNPRILSPLVFHVNEQEVSIKLNDVDLMVVKEILKLEDKG